ncbi:MAG: peptidoglycan editing factor PgeF [Peptococcaceae bacterium]|nr:peptidoglycan editing factor PgeF [Peptococcaceae bacterium]
MGKKQSAWLWQEKQGVRWVSDPMLCAGGLVRQGFCGRTGGVSQEPYASLNISYLSGDGTEEIRENRRRFAAACGFSLGSWCGLRQVHGLRIVKAEKKDAGRGVLDPAVVLEQADGQITDIPGLTLITQHADCIPLYFLDPVHKAIGLAHAGWKGTMSGMAGVMVEALVKAYGSRPQDLLVAVGPGAGPCHYEVDEPVIRAATALFGPGSRELSRVLLPSKKPGRAYADLWQANVLLLERRGVKAAHISCAGLCTICENREFFSHRKGDAGRQCAFLQLI